MELETPWVEVELGTPGVEIGIRTPGVENPNTNGEDAETENEEDEEDAETDITEGTWERSILETTGATEEHDVPQATDNAEENQPIKQEDINKALPEQEYINEALPENWSLPENKDYRGNIKDKYEIPNEVSHTRTLTPSTQAVYGM